MFETELEISTIIIFFLIPYLFLFDITTFRQVWYLHLRRSGVQIKQVGFSFEEEEESN